MTIYCGKTVFDFVAKHYRLEDSAEEIQLGARVIKLGHLLADTEIVAVNEDAEFVAKLRLNFPKQEPTQC